MSDTGESASDALDDALLAAQLCAIDPGLGGLVLRGGGDLRDAVISTLRAGLPDDAPLRRVPVHVDDERLLGGLDLGATLSTGRVVTSTGLLAEAEGGVIVLPMAERASEGTAARIAAAIDGGARFVTVALDDGREPEERAPLALAERLAFWVDLDSSPPPRQRPGPSCAPPGTGARPSPGNSEMCEVDISILEALAMTALALGVDSTRAALFALRTARAAARLDGRAAVHEADVVLAARLVLAPRATRYPTSEQEAPNEEAPPPPPEQHDGDDQNSEPGETRPLDDVVLAAALAALPRDVLARIASGLARRGPNSRARGAGERRRSPERGRPVGVRAGVPRGGLRLSLIDTLRAAAPWQRLRGRDGTRVRVRRDDLRIRRFETRAEAVTIFVVDASGSSAVARLAEAKGAVELLLAEAYVKRAQVALIAFRGTSAETLLPPTRSLTRARRALSDLPGGGGTPLAAGLVAARELAEGAAARGRTPFIVVLTDGRANVALDGGTVRHEAEQDADQAARTLKLAGVGSAFVDISARPRPEGARIAAAMGARYLPLPRADARAMHAAVSAARGA
ncbi:magnesium chelatase subunit D [soil metagenome]